MSYQTCIDNYFKPKSLSKSFTMSQKSPKKRFNLSLSKGSPAKTPRTDSSIINISSEHETSDVSPSPGSDRYITEDMVETIILDHSPSTPRKSQHSSPVSQNSGSSSKFYSPNKKRSVYKKHSPAKKNLNRDLFGSEQPCCLFKTACEGMDDMTIFLLDIINSCLNNHSLKSLLDENSQIILSNCFHVKKPGMRVICRLYWRQTTIYRFDDIVKIANDKKNYFDIQRIQDMINDLVQKGLLEVCNYNDSSILDFHEMTSKMKAEELKLICKELHIKIQSKQSAIKLLEDYCNKEPISKFFTQTKTNTVNNKTRVMQILQKRLGSCYRLSEKVKTTLYELYLLTYLGINYSIIRERRLELTLLHNSINRETFPISRDMVLDNASVVFKNRTEFEKYLEAHLTYENFVTETDDNIKCVLVRNVYEMYKKIDPEDMIRYKSMPEWLRRYTPPYIYIKILGEGILSLKRIKNDAGSNAEFAVEVLNTIITQDTFRLHKKAKWYIEKALVLQKYLGRHDEAAQFLLEGLQSNDLSDDIKDAIRPQAIIISKQKTNVDIKLREILDEIANKNIKLEKDLNAEHLYKLPLENFTKGKLKFEVCINGIRQALSVEDYCIWHYTNNGTYTHGGHWEGRIVTTIFFLLFWDIIYSKPQGQNGIFLSYYQRYPLDLYCDSFYLNRKKEIDDRLRSLSTSTEADMLDAMRRVWNARPEGELSGLTREIELEKVEMVASCLGPGKVSVICERLAKKYGYAHSGFPDVTLWNIHTKEIIFMEVKSDADRPSVKQVQWMHYLQRAHLRVAFCYVGTHSHRQRTRSL